MNRPEKTAGFTQSGFGFQKAGAQERTRRVGKVFASVAPSYDLMNDLMSLGVHRLWKAEFVRRLDPQPGERILDLAGGTGDIAMLLVKKTGTRDWGLGTKKQKGFQSLVPNPQSPITVCDINPAMLEKGRARAADRGFFGKIDWVEGNAENLPFEDAQFDAVTIAFGLRNVTHISQALSEARRVLKPGGRFFCLEFSRPALPLLEKAYDRYSFSVLPFLGKKVARDEAAYRYLAESIRAFPEQEKLAGLMRAAGFSVTRWRNLSLGIAAVHWGYRA